MINPKFFESQKVTYTDEDGVQYGNENTLLMRFPRQMKEYTVPNGVTTIHNHAACHCSYGLESITMPDSVMEIGSRAFKDCWNLRYVSLPKNIQCLGYEAFSDCSNLTTIIIPNGSIGESAFRNCKHLTDVILREGVTYIGKKAFSGCSCLSYLYLPGSIKGIEPDAFDGTAIKEIHVPAAHKQRFEQMGICNPNNDTPIILVDCEDFQRKTPNLFMYATFELSQDAFISWLLMWGNEEYQSVDAELHAIACKMIQTMIGETDEINVKKVKVKQQEEHIDVLAIVNDKNDKQYAIIIEDKTDTSEHSNQLLQYTKYVQETYKDTVIKCVYYKSGNECDSKIQKMVKRYNESNKNNIPLQVLSRSVILDILRSEVCNNIIIQNYIDYLQRIEKLTKSFFNTHVSEWGSRAWEGFALELEKQLIIVGKILDTNIKSKWQHQRYDGGIEFTLESISVKGTDAKLFLQINGSRKDKNLKNTRLCFRIKGLKENPKEWEEKLIPAFIKNNKQLISTKQTSGEKRTFAYLEGKSLFLDYFGDTGSVSSIAKRLFEWQEKLRNLADQLSVTVGTN